jgi:oligo-1,6-glucosidase
MDSIDDYNDISTKNHYRIALADGLSEKEALDAVARYSPRQRACSVPVGRHRKRRLYNRKALAQGSPRLQNAQRAGRDEKTHSVYHFYKKMIAIRKSAEYNQTLTYGSITPILLEYDNVIAYKRSGEKNICVICSFDHEKQTVTLPFELKIIFLNNYPEVKLKENRLELLPYQSISAEI